MKKIATPLEGVYIIEPQVFGDERGWFMETYSLLKFQEIGLDIVFIQDNHSFSAQKGVLRGLHFQKPPFAQTKLLRCVRGEILDVAVDIRKGSPDYLKWTSVILSTENKRMLYIPKGFAHGFVTLSENVEVQYKVDSPYCPECDMSIQWNDPAIGVQWGVTGPVLSKKDMQALPIGENGYFEYGENL